MSSDLRALLDVPSDEIKKPPVWPVGTYHGFIEKYETGKTKEKGTAFLRVQVKCMRPSEALLGANPDFFTGVEVNKRSFKKDFYLMEDKSQHWRLKAMLEAIGIAMDGITLLAAVPMMQGKNIQFDLTQRPNQDNTELYNEIADSSIRADNG